MKVFVSALIMAVVLLYLKTYMTSVSFLFIIFLNVIGIIIYLIILYFMKIKFLNDFIFVKIKIMRGIKWTKIQKKIYMTLYFYSW